MCIQQESHKWLLAEVVPPSLYLGLASPSPSQADLNHLGLKQQYAFLRYFLFPGVWGRDAKWGAASHSRSHMLLPAQPCGVGLHRGGQASSVVWWERSRSRSRGISQGFLWNLSGSCSFPEDVTHSRPLWASSESEVSRDFASSHTDYSMHSLPVRELGHNEV